MADAAATYGPPARTLCSAATLCVLHVSLVAMPRQARDPCQTSGMWSGGRDLRACYWVSSRPPSLSVMCARIMVSMSSKESMATKHENV